MMIFKLNPRPLFILSFIVAVLTSTPFYNTQNQTTSTNQADTSEPFIRWVGQIATRKDLAKKPSLIDKLMKLILGKRGKIFLRPFSLWVENNDEIWVLDQGMQTVILIHPKLGDITHIKGDNSPPFPSLTGLCALPGEEILFTDSGLNRIFALNKKNLTIRELNDTLLLERPTGIAYSRINKEIWVVETGAHRITILDQHGKWLRRFGGRGTGHGEFNFPTFIWIDNSGTVYVVDSMNFRVQIFDRHGQWISEFGEAGDATGYFARPKGIATDSRGHIYVVDALFHTVQIFDKQGNFLFNFGNQGRGKGEFWLPVGIYIDDFDRIYVADSYNSRIQMFQFVQGGNDER